MGDGDEQGVVKIADFGLARVYQAPLKPLSENGVCIPFHWSDAIFMLKIFKIVLFRNDWYFTYSLSY